MSVMCNLIKKNQYVFMGISLILALVIVCIPISTNLKISTAILILAIIGFCYIMDKKFMTEYKQNSSPITVYTQHDPYITVLEI